MSNISLKKPTLPPTKANHQGHGSCSRQRQTGFGRLRGHIASAPLTNVAFTHVIPHIFNERGSI